MFVKSNHCNNAFCLKWYESSLYNLNTACVSLNTPFIPFLIGLQ